MGREKLEIPLDGGTLELRIEFKFIPKEKEDDELQQQLFLPSGNRDTRALPATKSQKSLITNLSKKLGRDIDVETLSKQKASFLIQKMLAEINNPIRYK